MCSGCVVHLKEFTIKLDVQGLKRHDIMKVAEIMYGRRALLKKVLIISDTHGLLRDEVKAKLPTVDFVIHAGDINTPMVLQYLNEHSELFIIRGNNDKEWACNLPKILAITIEGVRILLVHNKEDIPKGLTNIDVVIYGHSHKYDDKIIDGVLWLNPGSCGNRRFNLPISMCEMWISGETYKYEKIIIK